MQKMAISKSEYKLKQGVEKYLYLRRRLYETDVSVDADFQRAFNGFFRMRQRSSEFYKDFFYYLELHKNTEVSFEDAITTFYEKFHRLEISFTSKLVALANPQKPIWDSVVTYGHFGIKAPSYGSGKRLEKAIARYYEYCGRYADYMKTAEAKALINQFNHIYENVEITDEKKVDFMLWVDRTKS